MQLQETPCRWGRRTLWVVDGGKSVTDEHVQAVLQRYAEGRSAVGRRAVSDEPRVWLDDDLDTLTRAQMELALKEKAAV